MVYPWYKSICIEYNRIVFPANRIKINPTQERCLRVYRQIKGEDKSCREVQFGNMTDQLQGDYLHGYEGIQAEMYQVSQYDESTAVITTYLRKVRMSKQDAFRAQEQFSLTVGSTTTGNLIRKYK